MVVVSSCLEMFP